MSIQWKKKGSGYVSACGRFEINRMIRRYGIEWLLTDKIVPIEHGVSGSVNTLREAKDTAEWRLINRGNVPCKAAP